MPGVFIFKRSRLTISNIVIPLDGSSPPSPAIISMAYDVYPQWLIAAVDHAAAASKAAAALDKIWTGKGHKREITAIERELRHSMQAAVAAATAFDAFYDTVKQLSSAQTAPTSQKRSGARYARIAEQLRRSFKVKQPMAKVLRARLKDIYHFRDEALHPPASIRDTYEHPRLNVGMERRFLMYRGENAVALAQNSLSIIDQLLDHPKPKFPELVEHCKFAKIELRPLVRRWEKQWGPLLPKDS